MKESLNKLLIIHKLNQEEFSNWNSYLRKMESNYLRLKKIISLTNL